MNQPTQNTQSNFSEKDKAMSFLNRTKNMVKENKSDVSSSFLSYTKSNIKVLNSINKNISEINRKIDKISVSNSSKDYLRRADPNKGLYKSLTSIEGLMSENNKLQKKKEGLGLGAILGSLGALLAGGGILGFLLTGKKEFLYSTIKSLAKFLPTKLLFEPFNMIFRGLSKFIGEKFGFVFKPIKNILGAVSGKITGIFKPVTEIFEKIGGIFGKGAGKEAAKIAGKGGAKTALKKIPVVGALLGLFFGIERFKKGDIVGGLLEVGSGIASIFPGIGTAISLGIDGFLLFRDFKGAITESKGDKKIKTNQPINWENVPVIGLFVKGFDAIKKFATDPLGSLEDMAGIVGGMFPEVGEKLGTFIGWVKSLKDKIMGSAPVKAAVQTGGAVLNAIKDFAPKAMSAAKDLGSGAVDMASSAKSNLYNKVQSMGLDDKSLMTAASNIGSKAVDTAKDLGAGAVSIAKKGLGLLGIKLGNNVDISGVVPDVWNRFSTMAQKYYEKTGKTINVNSAFRDVKKQAKLYADSLKSGRAGFVAKPGRSLHGKGLAIDINSSDANALHSLGLLKDFGFHRPLLNAKHAEPWHIETVGARSKSNEQDTPAQATQIGDYIQNNLPSSSVPKVETTNNVMELSERSIAMLAEIVAKAIKSAITMPNSTTIVQTGIRG